MDGASTPAAVPCGDEGQGSVSKVRKKYVD